MRYRIGHPIHLRDTDPEYTDRDVALDAAVSWTARERTVIAVWDMAPTVPQVVAIVFEEVIYTPAEATALISGSERHT